MSEFEIEGQGGAVMGDDDELDEGSEGESEGELAGEPGETDDELEGGMQP